MFRHDYEMHRCLIPPAKFYEWKRIGEKKKENIQRYSPQSNDSFKKIIIVKDVIKPWYDDDGILTMSIYDFLLNENSLDI